MKKQDKLLNSIIYGLGIIIVIIIAYFVITNINNNAKESEEPKIVFQIKGDERITHNLGETYSDLGVILDGDNIDITKDFSIENNVNVNEEGSYTVKYKYKDKVLIRHVDVKKINSFELKGEENIYILLNGEYQDDGVEAIVDGQDATSSVVISNNIDSTKEGRYTITYSLSSLNKTLTRYINVSNFDTYFRVNTDDDIENNTVSLNIQIDKDKITKYIMPDESEKTDNDSYKVDKNGTYKFIIYDKYNNKLEKDIEVNSIKIPLEISCKAIAYYNKTEITVTSNKNIKKYIYNGNQSDKNTFTFNSSIKENKVIVYDENDEKTEVKCETEIDKSSRLEIHFIASGYYDDAILIRTPNATIFMDGGRGKDRVINYLRELNVNKIDYVIGSHTEYDHIDAQGAVITNFDVKHVIYPNSIYSCGCSCEANDVRSVLNGLSMKGLRAGVQGVPSRLQIEDMALYFIAPFQIGCNKNNNSFVFILQFGNKKFMFTGDSDSPLNQAAKLQQNAQAVGLPGIQADLFKYPHHGNQMLGNSLINAINPSVIIIPNYNAPGNTGNISGRPVYRQSDSTTGNILVTSDGNNIEVKMNANAQNYRW